MSSNYPYQAPPNTIPLWTGSPRGDVQQPFTFPLAGSFHPEHTPTSDPLDWIDKRYGIPFGRYQGDLIPNQDPHLINGAYLVAVPPHIDSARTAIAREELKRRYPAAGEPPAEAQTDLLVAEWQGHTPAWVASTGTTEAHPAGSALGSGTGATASTGAASTALNPSGPLPVDQILQGLQQIALLAQTVAQVQADIRSIKGGGSPAQGQSQQQTQPSQPASVSQSALTSAISPLASQATAALTELNKQVGTSGGGHWAQQLRSLALEVLKVNSKLAP